MQHKPRIGRKFGRLTVVSVYEYAPNKSGQHKYLCRCDCGGTRVTRWENLKRGSTKSCGCLVEERPKSPLAKLGYKNDIGSAHPLYGTWLTMLRRCYDPSCAGYKKYGAKGVTVSRNWLDSAKAFADYVGPKPTQKHTLDRIDPAGNYEPGNVRWADRYTQAENKREKMAQYIIEIKGKRAFASEWAAKLGLNVDVIRRDIRRGVPPPVSVIAALLRKKLWSLGRYVPPEEYAACYAAAEKYVSS